MVTQALPRLCLTDRILDSHLPPPPQVGSLQPEFSQRNKALSGESCPEVHVKTVHYIRQQPITIMC